MTDREQKSVRKAAKKAAARPGPRADKADGEAAVLAKIAAMPALQPTLYYGMPWYAKDGKRVCFFRADKYMTFGLTEEAKLSREEGAHQLLASAWYFAALDDPTEAKLSAIVRTAAR
jgi:hypothetical protein